jgi:DNA-binding CsgD family transcriptional regulator
VRRAGDPDSQLDFLEAAYAWELDDRTWLHRLVEATVRVWGRPVWACGYEYDASDVARFGVQNPVFVDAAPQVPQVVGQAFGDLPPETVAGTYRKVTAGFARDIGGLRPEHAELLKQIDTVDYFGINALDPSGLGCFVGIGTERPGLFPHELGLYERLSSHMAAAYRIRRRLRQQDEPPLQQGEASVRPDGSLLDAHGAATEAEALAAIQEATRRRESARQRGEPEPTGGWLPRVSGRWTLVDTFDHGGQRYVVARENQSRPEGLTKLTDREQQVVASAAAGRSTKEIAYDLGISHATTRVLMSRAYRRLGVRSRSQLFELPCIQRLRGELAAAEAAELFAPKRPHGR